MDAFPTEDDRHAAATIMLFQSYMGVELVEFIRSSMGKASRDLFGGVATGSRKRPAKFMHNGFGGETAVDDDVSEYNDDNPDNKLEYRAILTASMALRERRFLYVKKDGQRLYCGDRETHSSTTWLLNMISSER